MLIIEIACGVALAPFVFILLPYAIRAAAYIAMIAVVIIIAGGALSAANYVISAPQRAAVAKQEAAAKEQAAAKALAQFNAAIEARKIKRAAADAACAEYKAGVTEAAERKDYELLYVTRRSYSNCMNRNGVDDL